MKTVFVYIIVLFFTASCVQKESGSISNKKNMNGILNDQWDQIKRARSKEEEKELVYKFMEFLKTMDYAISNPTYISNNGAVKPFSEMFDDKKGDQLKGINIEIINDNELGDNKHIKLVNWKPIDNKSALMFLRE
ncbi:hypothetical protein AY601_1800 [Pedobacter cryoconitis]|uniref:Lipoprotein n=1 Tax=Pedobacter cryoconitis TaxID=188932 RepID=A0A127VBW1_9SPHI|nr:hypothetical protein [Pedobacter cryoconitis]AMP98709.1 hypothetical protein AY601_1800 [Pedobacter cryoconitis]